MAKPTTSTERSQPTRPQPTIKAARIACFAVLFAGSLAMLSAASAQAQATKAYDSQILRLSEILGAVHYLRELCGAGEGQLWREQMRSIIRAEGSSALRRARLTRSFNEGYRSYSRTYKICTSSAKTAVERFLTEGTGIAEELIKQNP